MKEANQPLRPEVEDPPCGVAERTCPEDESEMLNQAHIRTVYATTRSALMQSQSEFRWLLRDLLHVARTRESTRDETMRLRRSIEEKRLLLRRQLRELARIGHMARPFPGLTDRAIEDSNRLFQEQSI